MKKIIYLLFISLLFSCEEMPTKEINIDESRTQVEVTKVENNEPEIAIEKSVPKKEHFQCDFGEIKIDVENQGNELIINSSLKEGETYKHEIAGNIISFIETDVNADGFNEFYCITDQGDLVAYSSYRNKSFGEIYVPQKPSHFYGEIRDLESWEVKNNKLHLTFSNVVDDVLNTVRYKLIQGEASYRLEAN